jgi:hypothetical protein
MTGTISSSSASFGAVRAKAPAARGSGASWPQYGQ